MICLKKVKKNTNYFKKVKILIIKAYVNLKNRLKKILMKKFNLKKNNLKKINQKKLFKNLI